MIRGYARNTAEEAELLAAGVPARAIYVEGRGAESVATINMRYGEWLATAGGLRPLGNSVTEIMAVVDRIHRERAAIVDVRTGQRSDRNVGKMLDGAISRIRGEATMPPGHAEAMAAARWAGKKQKRLSEHEARIRYLGLTPEYAAMSVKQRIRACGPGWSKATLWRAFKKTGMPRGRRPKPKS